ncbi:MAG: FMN-binding protein [Candidatus Omnitrophota bacterium]|nr:FMN-binding protein [Candidatus Omnitrophota bacterium]
MPFLKRTAISAATLAAFIFFTPLALVQNVWCKFVLRRDITVTAGLVTEAYARVLSTVQEALNTFMPEAEIRKEEKSLTDEQMAAIEEKAKVSLDSSSDRKRLFYVGERDGEVLGYAVEDAVAGKWGPIYYMLFIDPGGEIKDTLVLAYEEKRGKPVAKRRFLKQFQGKSVDSQIRLMRDIRGVTGASISSRGMTDGIRKMVHIFHQHYGGGS